MASTGKVEIVVTGKDEASKTFTLIGKAGEDMSKKFVSAGKAMMAAGAGIVAGLVAATSAAQTERVNIQRLSAVLDNVGVSYDNVKESLEAVILATQHKTGVADDQQRAALSELVIATGDYQKALELLPLVIDLAAAKEMDLSTAAEVVGRVAAGNVTILTRYGITLEEGATAAEALAAMQDKVTGAAEKMANPIDILKASLSDMTESIGNALLPTLQEFTDKAVVIIEKISAWATENPKVMQTLLGIGGVLVAGGAILMGLGSLSKAIAAVNTALAIMKALSGPAGWATLAAGLAIAAGAVIAIDEISKSGEKNTSNEMQQLMDDYQAGKITDDEFLQRSEKYSSGYASGGIVPGKLGAPVPIIAHGGEKFLGTNGQMGSGGASINIGTMIGDEASMRNFARQIKQLINEDNRRTAFGQVNSGYYYGRSAL